MALTGERWIIAAIAGAFVVASLALTLDEPSTRWQRTERERMVSRLRRAENTAQRAALRLQIVSLADSVRRALARVPASPNTRFVVGGGLSDRQRQNAARIERLASAFAPAPARHPVDVVFVSDTMQTIRGELATREGLITYVMPVRDGDRCVAILRATSWTAQYVAAQALGPCGFYQAFGTPGPEINRWLRDGAWHYARWSFGKQPPALWRPDSWYFRQYYAWGRAAGFPLRHSFTVRGYACAAGNTAACEEQVVTPAGRVLRFDRANLWTVGLTTNMDGVQAFGPRERYLLHAIAADLGAERFLRFWTSSLPVSDAFREASGRDLGEWTAAWAGSSYGTGLETGPTLPPLHAGAGIAVVIAGLGIGALVARRRQVS